MDNKKETHNTDPVSSSKIRTIKKRKLDISRTILVMLLSSTMLIFFLVWYKSWPQRMDCYREAVRIAQALNKYIYQHHKLPPVLTVLSIPKGRYGIGHYEYRFIGLGLPQIPPEGTIICYCAKPHQSLIHEPGRHILIFKEGNIKIIWVTEKEFQKIIKNTPPPQLY